METCLGGQNVAYENNQIDDIAGMNRGPRRPGRPRLSDITNIQQPPPVSKPAALPSELKDSIPNVQKENMMLRRLLEERSKLLELSGLELQKLRANLQKLYAQNMQLAKANSQMLAELNLGKDKLKQQQHEHGCAIALMKAKNFALEEKFKEETKDIREVTNNCKEATVEIEHADLCKKPCTINTRRQSRNASSVGITSGRQEVAVTDKIETKRRRRSSAFRMEQTKPSEDLFDVEDAHFPDPLPDKTLHIDDQSLADITTSASSLCNTSLKKDKRDENATNQLQQSSFGKSVPSEVGEACPPKKKPLTMEKKILENRRKRSSVSQPEIEKVLGKAKSFDLPGPSNGNDDVKERTEENGEKRPLPAEPLEGRRRSLRTTVMSKVVSYKEKPVNIKERRQD